MSRVLLLLMLTVCLFSCQKELSFRNNDNTSSSEQLWPLKVGNKWTYIDKNLEEDGTVTFTQTVELLVIGTININNKDHFVLIDENYPADTAFLLWSDNKAVYAYSEDSNKDIVYYKWPATEGEIINSKTFQNTKVEWVASTGSFTFNSFESRKVIINDYINGKLNYYSELFFTPKLGITGYVGYTKKRSGNGYYKSYEQVLVDYELK